MQVTLSSRFLAKNPVIYKCYGPLEGLELDGRKDIE